MLPVKCTSQSIYHLPRDLSACMMRRMSHTDCISYVLGKPTKPFPTNIATYQSITISLQHGGIKARACSGLECFKLISDSTVIWDLGLTWKFASPACQWYKLSISCTSLGMEILQSLHSSFHSHHHSYAYTKKNTQNRLIESPN